MGGLLPWHISLVHYRATHLNERRWKSIGHYPSSSSCHCCDSDCKTEHEEPAMKHGRRTYRKLAGEAPGSSKRMRTPRTTQGASCGVRAGTRELTSTTRPPAIVIASGIGRRIESARHDERHPRVLWHRNGASLVWLGVSKLRQHRGLDITEEGGVCCIAPPPLGSSSSRCYPALNGSRAPFTRLDIALTRKRRPEVAAFDCLLNGTRASFRRQVRLES